MPVIMVPDLLVPTDEMHTTCHAVARDLHQVRTLLVFHPPAVSA
jgi:hypothetical protein